MIELSHDLLDVVLNAATCWQFAHVHHWIFATLQWESFAKSILPL
jgi:hypothetical protein